MEARASNGAGPRVTSLPSEDEYLEWKGRMDIAETAQAQAVGGWVVWGAKHWVKIAGVGAFLLSAWQWNDTRVENNVLAAQAGEHQAAQVETNRAAIDASTKVDVAQNARLDGIDTRVGQTTQMGQTILEVLGKQKGVRAALRKDEKLAKKVKAALEVKPLAPAPKPAPAGTASGSL